MPLKDNKSLFQSSVERSAGLPGADNLLVICNDEHRFMAAEQLRQSGVQSADILLEPVGRNTAPAVTIAAIHALTKNPDVQLLVLPSDHIIADVDVFRSAVAVAQRAAGNTLATFGVVPTRAETGFGYIRRHQASAAQTDKKVIHEVDEFVEKPDLATAQAYLSSGDYLWNSGMFLFRADLYLNELKRLQPELFTICLEAYENSTRDLDFIRLEADSFAKLPTISIDYAVMEKTTKATVVPFASGWSDVGSWHALWELLDKDDGNNATYGDVMAVDCGGCYIHAHSRLVTAVGIKDQVIIETSDAVLVTPRDRAQQVRDIVDELIRSERTEADIHPKVYRPWGAYETIDRGDRFQVKRITVNPGQVLSLQMHHHRAEHWVVVQGTAKVTRGKEVFLLRENESTYIPVGTKHRLENSDMMPLEIIEVQSGTYLGEDDIIRFEDLYGR